MARTYQLKLLTPDRSLFEGEVEALIMPGELGQLGVLAGHTKLMTTLQPGILRYVQNGQSRNVAISGGFAEVRPEGVTVLADTAEYPDEIDVERAERARDEAKKALERRPVLDEKEIERLEARLARAMNRLRATGIKD